MKHAIIDIDDTVADLRTIMCKELNTMCDMDVHWSQWKNVGLEDIYDITSKQLLTLLEEKQVIEQLIPHTECKAFIDALHELDYDVTFLTARKWHSNGRDVTTHWLLRHDLEYDNLILCDVTDDKSQILKDTYGKVAFTVDDSATHCASYANNMDIERVFVYDMPWNKRLYQPRIERITHLTDILEIIK